MTAAKKKRAAPKKPRQPRQPKPYRVTLSISGTDYKANGVSALDALDHLKIPEKISNKGIMIFTKGKKSADFLFTIPRLKRLSLGKITRFQFAKWVELRLS